MSAADVESVWDWSADGKKGVLSINTPGSCKIKSARFINELYQRSVILAESSMLCFPSSHYQIEGSALTLQATGTFTSLPVRQKSRTRSGPSRLSSDSTSIPTRYRSTRESTADCGRRGGALRAFSESEGRLPISTYSTARPNRGSGFVLPRCVPLLIMAHTLARRSSN